MLDHSANGPIGGNGTVGATVGRGSRETRLPASVGQHQELEYLVMSTARSWRWPLTPDRFRKHEELLRTLLEPTPEAPAPWIRVVPPRRPTPERPPRVDNRYWHRGQEALTFVDELTEALEDGCLPGVRGQTDGGHLEELADAEQLEELTRELSGLQHRIYLESATLWALIRRTPELAGFVEKHSPLPDVPFVAVIDLRFFFHLRHPSCHVSVSVWSYAPRSPLFRPPGSDDIRGAGAVGDYASVFSDTVAQAVFELVSTRLGPRDEFRVFGRRYELPTFWVAVPDEPPLQPTEYLDRCERPPDAPFGLPADGTGTGAPAHQDVVAELAETLLQVGSPHDCVVVPTIIGGEALVLRRFHPHVHPEREDQDIPTYLLFPRAPRHSSGAGVADQEERLANFVADITELEAFASSELYQVEDEIQLNENHTQIYDATAERAAFLWDALSAHLPMRRGTNRNALHESVILMHQLLLQGVADIGHLVAQTQRCVTTVQHTTDTLLARYDQLLTEDHPWHDDGLRVSLARTGVVDSARQRGERAAKEAERVKARYDHQLAAIKTALDEWRVGETDVLQRASWALTVVLAFVGLVTVADAVVAMKPDFGGDAVTVLDLGPLWTARAAAAACLGIGALLICALLWVVWQIRRPGVTASTEFQRLYEGTEPRWRRRRRRRRYLSRFPAWLPWHPSRIAADPDDDWNCGGTWQFLAASSTDALDRFARTIYKKDFVSDQHAWKEAWDQRDRNLAARFAQLWDDALAIPEPTRADEHGDDIRGLRQRIEKWGIHALLLTERARKMHSYQLPRLTLLYRSCGWFDGSYLARNDSISPLYTDLPLATSMVALNDFTRAMTPLGLTWEEAEHLDWWLRARVRRTPPPVTENGPEPKWTVALLLVEIDRLGISATMKDTAAEALARKVTDEWRARMPQPAEA